MISWLPGWAVEEHGRFVASAMPWIAMGFNVIPSRGVGEKVPGVGFKEYYSPDSPRVDLAQLHEWSERFGSDTGALILLSSGTHLCAAVVDVDDPDHQEWVEAMFGETPLMVQSGRVGGGIHNYYAVRPEEMPQVRSSANLIGPEQHVDGEDIDPFKTRIDVKAAASYAVAPGSLHKSGAEYGLEGISWEDLNLEHLSGAPEFDTICYEDERNRGFLRRGSQRPKVQTGARGEPVGSMDFVDGGVLSPDHLVVDAYGSRRALKDVGDGERVHAPLRDDESPSCTVWRPEGGTAWYLYDWSTGERFSVRRPSWSVDAVVSRAGLGKKAERAGKGGDPDPAPTAPPGAVLTKKRIGEGGGKRQDFDDLDFPSYLDAPPPRAGGRDPLQLAKHGLDERLDHFTLDADVHQIAEIVDQSEKTSPHRVTFIQSPPGTGKTAYAEREWRRSEGLPRVAIGPRVSLTQGMTARYEAGAVCYQADEAETADAIVTTIHSLMRFSRFEGQEIELLVLDEFSAIIDQLCPKHKSLVDAPVATLRMLLYLIRKAKKVIIADADLTAWHIGFILDRLPLGDSVGLYTHAYRTDEAITTTSLDGARARMLEALSLAEKDPDYRLALQFDTKAEAQEVTRLLEDTFPTLRTVCVTGANADEKATHEMLANPDGMLRDYQVIIHNTAIDTGVSFNIKVDQVVTFYSNRDISPRAIMQMHKRFRNAFCRTLGMTDWKPERRDTDVRTLWQNLSDAHHADHRLATSFLKDRLNIGLDGGYRIDCPHYEAAYLAAQVQNQLAFADRADEIERLISTRFRHHEHDDTEITEAQAETIKAFQERRREAGERLEEERCETISEADKISGEEASRIDRKHVRTKPEKASLERSKIEDFYSRDIHPDLVAYDRKGKTRVVLRRLGRLRLRLEGHEDKLALIEAYRNKGKTLSRHRAHVLEAEVTTLVLLRALEIRPLKDGSLATWREQISGKFFAAEDLRERLWPLIEELRGALGSVEYLGRQPKEPEKVVRWFNAMMRKLGFEITRRKMVSGSDGGAWEYSYCLQVASVMGEPCFQRMLERFDKTRAAIRHEKSVASLKFAASMKKRIDSLPGINPSGTTPPPDTDHHAP